MLKWFQEKHATPVLINSKLVWEGLGGETDLGNWCRENDKKVLTGIGEGYVPEHMDVAL